MEHVEQHQRADAAVVERQRLGAGFAIVPGRAHQVRQLDAGDEFAREARPRSELDPAAERLRRQLGGDARVQIGVERAQRAVLRPGAPVLLEPLQRARPQLLGQRRRRDAAFAPATLTRT